MDEDGVLGGEQKLVRAGDGSAGGDAGAEDGAVFGLEFEEFGGARIDLLVDGGGELEEIGKWRRIFRRLRNVACWRDCFGPQREKSGAVLS